MTVEPTKLDIRELKESGLLQEVNRQFFHPLGLALAVRASRDLTTEDDGVSMELCCIWDGRDDPEGYVFDDLDAEAVARGEAVMAEQVRRLAIRQERLGFGIQPLEADRAGRTLEPAEWPPR